MIELPDFDKAFEYENNFYLSCDTTRIGKLIAHYELYKMTLDVPGAIIECGVFKGASLSRFVMLRDMLGHTHSKKIIAFDAFGEFPETAYADDQKFRKKFIEEAGEEGIGRDQMMEVLTRKGLDRHMDLVEGDITKTVPEYLDRHPALKISLLNLDTDVYESSSAVLEYLYPRLLKGGVLILDDYGTFPGETAAADEYFKDKNVEIRKFGFCMTPSYVVKTG
ncbi:MAG: TylF/MycF/NovP-related O-methyltransferase [Nitrospinota bacterium]|jgi:hypothetical protein|nr:TylF/MycF/NovP-related O-methyltransferase [Nitrospinota bacterium]